MIQDLRIVLLWATVFLLHVDFIVCPPVTDKPPESTSLSEEQQEDLVKLCFVLKFYIHNCPHETDLS